MLHIWNRCRGGGMGPGLLPDEGGINDQACIMMEAFDIMDAALAKLVKEEKDREEESAAKQGTSREKIRKRRELQQGHE